MKISTNDKLIDRNKKISQAVFYLSMTLLTFSFIWSIMKKEAVQQAYAYMILLPAYVLVQVSISLANKWGRSPRPDEIVASSLKGFNNQYSLYIYTTGVPHLLVGPAGIWIVNPYQHSGEISYDTKKKRFIQKGGGNFLVKVFAQEGLPNIEREDENLLMDFNRYLQKNNISLELEAKVVNIFFSEKADLHTKDAPVLCLAADKFKDYLRQSSKKSSIPDAELKKVTDQLPEPND